MYSNVEQSLPLIHIGYVKTGSTWLQKYIFNDSELGFMSIAERRSITYELIRPYELYYDSRVIRTHIEPRLAKCQTIKKIPILTHERLAGNPISGGYDNVLIARRLHDLLPIARILIVIREQRSMMLSIYKEYISGGGACSLNRFMYPPPGAKIPLFDFHFFEFHHLISYYQRLFSSQNVLVLPFELFVNDKEKFCRKIIEFSGCSNVCDLPRKRVRVSSTSLTTAIRCFLNLTCYRDNSNPSAWFHIPALAKTMNRLDRFIPLRIENLFNRRFQNKIDVALTGQFIESNRITASITGLDLANFGYMT